MGLPATPIPLPSTDLLATAQEIATGFPSKALFQLQEKLGLNQKDLSTLLSMSQSTIARRLRNDAKLAVDESDRVNSVWRLFDLAVSVIGGEEGARRWFADPNFSLGWRTPLELSNTEPGRLLVKRVLHQIEHGMTV